MSRSPVEPELEGLLSTIVESWLNPDDADRLANLLRDDPAARTRYRRYLELHLLLESEYASPAPPVAFPTPRRLIRFVAAAVIVLGFAAAMSVIMMFSASRPIRSPGPPIAVLTDASGAQWDPATDLPTAVGSQLGGGFLRLKTGTATIEFYSGAQIMLAGPCEFGLNSEKRGFLKHGRLTAYVPDRAHGFTVAAPGLVVVDLGTAFTLNVQSKSQTDLHVLRGVVEVSRINPRTGEMNRRRLTEDQTMLVRGEDAKVLLPPTIALELDPASGWVGARGILWPVSEGHNGGRVGVGGRKAVGERQGIAAVMIFRLPVLEPGAAIRDANLQLALTGQPTSSGVTPRFGADLYLLGGRSEARLTSADYFAGPVSSAPPGSVLIERSLLTPGPPAPDGTVKLSSSARRTLAEQLQSLYNPDGHPRQPFVALRLNPDAAMPTSSSAPLSGYPIVWRSADQSTDGPRLWIKP